MGYTCRKLCVCLFYKEPQVFLLTQLPVSRSSQNVILLNATDLKRFIYFYVFEDICLTEQMSGISRVAPRVAAHNARRSSSLISNSSISSELLLFKSRPKKVG